MLFVTLQMVLIICYPRLNLRLESGISHLGLMHLVATNLIVWIRTIYKESIVEFQEVTEEENEAASLLNEEEQEEKEVHHVHGIHNLASLKALMLGRNISLNIPDPTKPTGEDVCFIRPDDDPLKAFTTAATPILYPFVIEFVLIGATVFYNTWRHVADQNHSGRENHMYRPNMKAYVKSLDWSHSAVGALLGAVVFICNIVNLSLFFGFSTNETDEIISKCTNTVINAVTVVACLQGVVKIQFLKDQPDESGGVNSFLLLLSGFFFLIYSGLEIVVGVLEESSEAAVDSVLQICNGIFSIAACISLLIFIKLMMLKVSLSRSSLHIPAHPHEAHDTEG